MSGHLGDGNDQIDQEGPVGVTILGLGNESFLPHELAHHLKLFDLAASIVQTYHSPMSPELVQTQAISSLSNNNRSKLSLQYVGSKLPTQFEFERGG